jgi:para-aminobenzoate synthetase component 1
MKRYPLVTEIRTLLDAPSCFELFKERPFNFFLDSSMDPAWLGRYSFMGSDPFLVLRSHGEEITLIWNGETKSQRGNPFNIVGELLATYSLDGCPEGIPLAGGAVGYFGYDLCHFIERLPSTAVDDLHLPECYLAFYDVVLAFDHETGRKYLISTGFPDLDEAKREPKAKERLKEVGERLQSRFVSSFNQELSPISTAENILLKSNFSYDEYLRAVETAREYICAGDIFQVNLSQRFEATLNISPYELYQRLRRINPAPFASFLNFDDLSIVSASPERFLKVQGDWVETRPIKGTRPRGKSMAEDSALAEELLSSVKDRAENVMIVDLERTLSWQFWRVFPPSFTLPLRFGVGSARIKIALTCSRLPSREVPSPARPKCGQWRLSMSWSLPDAAFIPALSVILVSAEKWT